jgi:hypothetical protein
MTGPPRFWPMEAGRIITSPFGPRSGGFHAGTDFGWPGGSAGKPVYAVQAGTVIYAGAASGYGGPDPAGWLVIDSTDAEGGGCLEYGHIIREVGLGARVVAGRRIGRINPNSSTNGGVAPHLHLSDMPYAYDPAKKQDPLPRLAGAREPGQAQEEKPMPSVTLADPTTRKLLNTNRYIGHAGNTPRWIAVHTQQGGGTADGLAKYLLSTVGGKGGKDPVSYHFAIDDREVILCCELADSPWSASNANTYAYHICMAGSFAEWSQGKWLETDVSDGKNEDLQLTNAARVIAYLCQRFNIPPVWIGGKNVPPWGLDGVCGHKDFGVWGGGHTDPGPNFPADELMRRVKNFLNPPTTPEVPVTVPNPYAINKPATQDSRVSNVGSAARIGDSFGHAA